ncbi:hypothetical protein TSAR_007850 [Trichomalopsis sarcophagae]|uniref:Uncharacterized protein n=1 Tax=Trichomalopsis sarcophagae TaxID=543379 RepID=A0A232FNF2_9HYME|nr:hypothetical protein TSAR_007850 [Trichomalopsis sarcophagae]
MSRAGTDSKSTIVQVKRIQLLGQEESFLFPVDKQTNAQHKQLYENSIVKNVVKSLKVRNKFRNVVLTLSDELKNIYLDTEESVCRNKDRKIKQLKNENINVTNNNEIQEVVASHEEPKNYGEYLQPRSTALPTELSKAICFLFTLCFVSDILAHNRNTFTVYPYSGVSDKYAFSYRFTFLIKQQPSIAQLVERWTVVVTFTVKS